jgi:hypothetical protein
MEQTKFPLQKAMINFKKSHYIMMLFRKMELFKNFSETVDSKKRTLNVLVAIKQATSVLRKIALDLPIFAQSHFARFATDAIKTAA